MTGLRGLVALCAAITTALIPTTSAAAADSDDSCAVVDWEMTWGFKESFRAYLSGAIAKGEWITSGDLSYTTPNFQVSGSSGEVAADGRSGSVLAEGGIRFLGHGGLLDQTLRDPRISWNSDQSGAIWFDVSGATQEGVMVNTSDVEFVDVVWADVVVHADSHEVLLESKSVTLSAAGAEAFGTYPEGEEFDPIAIAVQLEPGCLATPEPAFPAWLIGAAVALVALAAGVTPVVRRLRGRGRREQGES